jgi:hypothetical protein
VIDASSGAVVFAPFYFQAGTDDRGNITCGHGLSFYISSELLIIQGELIPTGAERGKVGRHGFHWRQGKFSPVYFDSECSFF